MLSMTDSANLDSVTLVLATPEDAAMAFAWRNDPATRAQAHDSGPLTMSGHQAWWDTAIKAPHRHLLVAYKDQVAVGILRLDRTGLSAEVSIYLDPSRTGQGLGKKVLRAGLQYARSLGLDTLTASIKESNIASRSAFVSVGFERRDEVWVCRVM